MGYLLVFTTLSRSSSYRYLRNNIHDMMKLVQVKFPCRAIFSFYGFKIHSLHQNSNCPKSHYDYLTRQRQYSGEAAQVKKHVMKSWQIHEYGGVEKLMMHSSTRIPQLKRPDDILVEIHASSVNPIDTLVLGGYGASVWNLMRRGRDMLTGGSEFPLILGRDFSGEVVATGKSVKDLKPGDQIWGAVDASYRQGTHAEFAVISSSMVTKKPEVLPHVDAASIPYVALTTWSALSTAACLSQKKAQGKRILILGGSGGIGTFAIQLLRCWGADITTTCSTGAVELVTSLGAETVVDYTTGNSQQELLQMPRFDVVLDALGQSEPSYPLELLKKNSNSVYVTIVTPLLRNFDKHGFVVGGLKNIMSLGGDILSGLQEKKHYRWAFFFPNKNALTSVTSLVEKQQIIPVVEKIYPLAEVPDAFAKVMSKHNRGKTVINMKGQ